MVVIVYSVAIKLYIVQLYHRGFGNVCVVSIKYTILNKT